MESLNKQQLVLLALLVSFVTSLATGIVTVALMDQAPQGVTQTINRVVEKTIERVVTAATSTPQAAAVITKETIVVKADDAIVDAIAKNTKSLVRIREVTGSGVGRKERFASIGLLVSSEGLIVSDINVAYPRSDEEGNSIPESYIGVFPDGKIFPLNIVYSDTSAGLMFFQPLLQDREKGAYRFSPPSFGTAELKLGQAVVALGGSITNVASTGIISNLHEKIIGTAGEESVAEKVLISIKTDIHPSELVSGALLLNLTGEVVGVSAGAVSSNRSLFAPIQKVLDLLETATPVSTKVQ